MNLSGGERREFGEGFCELRFNENKSVPTFCYSAIRVQVEMMSVALSHQILHYHISELARVWVCLINIKEDGRLHWIIHPPSFLNPHIWIQKKNMHT